MSRNDTRVKSNPVGRFSVMTFFVTEEYLGKKSDRPAGGELVLARVSVVKKNDAIRVLVMAFRSERHMYAQFCHMAFRSDKICKW